MMLSVSIVTFNNEAVIKACLRNIFKYTCKYDFKVMIVDNNSSDNTTHMIEENFKQVRILKNKKNIGFGAAHNMAIQSAGGKYHLVLNPDIILQEDSIGKLIDFMDNNKDIGLISPKTVFPDGSIQYLCKREPRLFDLGIMRFTPNFIKRIFKKRIDYYEMRDTGYDKMMDVPNLSGSFMLFRKSVLDRVGGFDENYFIYFEDTDITRRTAEIARTVFYPDTSVIHLWNRHSHKNIKHFIISLISTAKYFKKWGWKIF